MPPIDATLCVGAAKITRRVAGRSGASTGCLSSHTLPYFLILSHNLSRGTSGFVALRRDKQAFALRRYIVCRYALPVSAVLCMTAPGYFSNALNIFFRRRLNLFREKPFCRSTTRRVRVISPQVVFIFIKSPNTSICSIHSFNNSV